MLKRAAIFQPPLFCAAGLIAAAAQFAVIQAAIVTTSVSTKKIAVGDLVNYSISIIAAKGTVITPPAPESDFGKVTVREWNLHKSERDKSDSCTYEYILTTYVPEPCTIPELHFVLENNGTADTLRTEAVPLQVISVLPSDTVDIKGLKQPFSAGKAPRWWLWVLGTLAALAGLAIGSLWLSKRLRKTPPPPPPVPPYEEAIDALADLGVKKYLQRGLVREYVFELSEIFKRYIGRRFDCNAAEFTTEEIIAWSSAADLPTKQRASIEWFFRATDPVKFARLVPDAPTVERFEPEVRDFLEATRPLLQESAAPLQNSGGETAGPPVSAPPLTTVGQPAGKREGDA
jgi:hypothetical protein